MNCQQTNPNTGTNASAGADIIDISALSEVRLQKESGPQKMTPGEIRAACSDIAQAVSSGSLDPVGRAAAEASLKQRSGLPISAIRRQVNMGIGSPQNENTADVAPSLEISEDDLAASKTLASQADLFNEFNRFIRDVGFPCQSYFTDAVLALLVAHRLDHSTAFVFTGPSGSGKSSIPNAGLSLLQPDLILTATALSSKAINYLGDIGGKTLSLGEIKNNKPGEEDNEAQMLTRQLISENRIKRMIVQARDSGPPEIVEVVTEGPCAITFSTTQDPSSFCTELANRCYWVPSDDSAETTRAANLAKAQRYQGKTISGKQESEIARQRRAWEVFFATLPALPVLIPFADQIIPTETYPAARRLYPQLVDLIICSALLHHANRSKKIKEGTEYIVATAEDYRRAYELAVRICPRREGAAKIQSREDYMKLAGIYRAGFDELTRDDISQGLGKLSRTTSQRRIDTMRRDGFLVDGSGGGRAKQYILVQNADQQDGFGFIHPDSLAVIKTFTA